MPECIHNYVESGDHLLCVWCADVRRPRAWRVTCHLSFTTPDGFQHSRQVPTFLLDPAIQGIRTTDDAERVARSVVLTAIAYDVTNVYVSVSALPLL